MSFTAVGKTAVPANVQELTFEATSDKEGTLRWTETVDVDVRHGGTVHIKHSSKTDGSGTWSNSVDLIKAVAGSSTSAKIPLVEGEVLVKFADDGGRQSSAATSVIIDLPDPQGKLVLEARREDQDSPPFGGTKTDCAYDATYDALIINSDGSGNVLTSAEYQFANTLDLGGVFALELTRRFITRGIYPTDLIDSRTANIDSWDEFDGSEVDQVNAKLYVRKTNDNPSSSPTYGIWNEFV